MTTDLTVNTNANTNTKEKRKQKSKSAQELWLKEKSTKFNETYCPFILYPELNSYNEFPNIKSYYCKKTYVFIPHIQCPDVKRCCPSCNKELNNGGYPSNPFCRVVEDVHEISYLLQYRYNCNHCNKTVYSMELLENYPIYVQLQIPIILSEKSAYTKNLLLMLINDCTNNKSFSSISRSIGIYRSTNYLTKKALYLSSIDLHKKVLQKNTLLTNNSVNYDFESFSSFDDINGYNEHLYPDSKFLSDIFIKYINDNKDLMEKLQLPTSSTNGLSIDTTFNVMKRTKIYNINDGKFVPQEERQLSIIMTIEGQIISMEQFKDNNVHKGTKEQLRKYKNFCMENNYELPTYISVDNCCYMKNLLTDVFPNVKIVQDAKHVINRYFYNIVIIYIFIIIIYD